jgi:rhodanese-related sulfurtransferase
MAFTTGPVELNRRIEVKDDIVIVNVREPEDYRKGHIPHAINLPKSKWQSADGLRKETLNVVYCYTAVCHLGAMAALEFVGRGFPVMEMDGGFEAWKENDLPSEKIDKGPVWPAITKVVLASLKGKTYAWKTKRRQRRQRQGEADVRTHQEIRSQRRTLRKAGQGSRRPHRDETPSRTWPQKRPVMRRGKNSSDEVLPGIG